MNPRQCECADKACPAHPGRDCGLRGRECPVCRGAGERAMPGDGLRTSRCSTCKGTGFVPVPLTILFRVDMEDRTGIAFCPACADDAMASGLFTGGGAK